MYPATIHHRPGIREHRRKYRLDGEAQTKRLANALRALEEGDESLRLALAANLCGTTEKSLADVKAALRLLVEEP